MTQSNKVIVPAAVLILVFVVLDIFLPTSVREQPSYRMAGVLFSVFLLVIFAYTRRMPEQRSVRTACFIGVAGTLALFISQQLGISAVGRVLMGLSLVCFLSAFVVLAWYLWRRLRQTSSA